MRDGCVLASRKMNSADGIINLFPVQEVEYPTSQNSPRLLHQGVTQYIEIRPRILRIAERPFADLSS